MQVFQKSTKCLEDLDKLKNIDAVDVFFFEIVDVFILYKDKIVLVLKYGCGIIYNKKRVDLKVKMA